MKTTNGILSFTRTVSFKFILIGVLSLFLLIPVVSIRNIINERQMRQAEVLNEISSSWGNAQSMAGPILTIPYKKYVETDSKPAVVIEYAHFLPAQLLISGSIEPEMRYRGIFKVAVYNTKLRTEGIFEKPDFTSLGIDPLNVDYENAFVSVGISDMRGIKNDVLINMAEEELVVIPGVPVKDILSTGFHARLNPENLKNLERLPFRFDISLDGSNSLRFYPIGKVTKVDLNSPWLDPSFEGGFLPADRNITDTGFTASWMVTHLNRNFPQSWKNTEYSIEDSSFGVGLFLPVSHYQKADRSAKYAIMFIGLTFLLFLLIEVLNAKRLHPIQYLLTGLSLSVFYALLISISEQIGFDWAFVVSAAAIILLISLYIQSGYHSLSFTLITTGVLTLLYAFLYIILQLQDYSLLFGSIGLFIVLGTFMFLTRKINWYKEETAVGEEN